MYAPAHNKSSSLLTCILLIVLQLHYIHCAHGPSTTDVVNSCQVQACHKGWRNFLVPPPEFCALYKTISVLHSHSLCIGRAGNIICVITGDQFTVSTNINLLVMMRNASNCSGSISSRRPRSQIRILVTTKPEIFVFTSIHGHNHYYNYG